MMNKYDKADLVNDLNKVLDKWEDEESKVRVNTSDYLKALELKAKLYGLMIEEKESLPQEITLNVKPLNK